MSGQCCSAEDDGGLAMGSEPLTLCLLILLICDLGSGHFSPHPEMTRPKVLKMPSLISFHRAQAPS